MIVNFKVELLDFEDQPVKKTGVVVTDTGPRTVDLEENVLFSSVVVNALTSTYRSDENITPEEKLKRFALSERIVKEGLVELTIEEAALIKKLALKGCSVLAYGRIDALLEGSAG